jgi:hypothetical protein
MERRSLAILHLNLHFSQNSLSPFPIDFNHAAQTLGANFKARFW